MGLPEAGQLAAAPLSIIVLGPGFGESIVLRAEGDTPTWAVIDSARRERRRSSVNPALDLLVAQNAYPSLVLLTHPHDDHTSGLAAIIERAQPGATVACVEPLMQHPSPYEPPTDPDDIAAIKRSQTKLAHVAINRAWQRGLARWLLLSDSQFDFADWTLTVLHPDEDTIGAAMTAYAEGRKPNLNDVSAALLIERDDVALVLAADGEQAAWDAVSHRIDPRHLRHTRPVKVPHHGSCDAIQAVLIDYQQRDEGRPQIVTPFPRSGMLPRFESDQGVERLLAAAGLIQLTAMPVDLVATGPPVNLAGVRAAMPAESFLGDEELRIRWEKPPGEDQLIATIRDPYKTWVLIGVHLDGHIDITRGAHAVVIVE